MTAETPGQAAFPHETTRAAYEAAQDSMADGWYAAPTIDWDEQDNLARNAWGRIAQAAIDAATEGSLRACGYTLADVGRFLEAEAAAQEPKPAPELTALRELLDEIGVMAANAPEDDAFAVCQDIAMRIAAIDVPDDGRHPDGCTCQFCREDEREERDREELDDDIDNTIPDTERGDL